MTCAHREHTAVSARVSRARSMTFAQGRTTDTPVRRGDGAQREGSPDVPVRRSHEICSRNHVVPGTRLRREQAGDSVEGLNPSLRENSCVQTYALEGELGLHGEGQGQAPAHTEQQVWGPVCHRLPRASDQLRFQGPEPRVPHLRVQGSTADPGLPVGWQLLRARGSHGWHPSVHQASLLL